MPDKIKVKCHCNERGICCYCGTNLLYHTHIPSRELDGHYFCIECYPRACDVYIADQKIKKFKRRKK